MTISVSIDTQPVDRRRRRRASPSPAPPATPARSWMKILARHPHAKVVAAFSSESFSLEALFEAKPEVVFLATPNEVSAEIVAAHPRRRHQGHRPLRRVPPRRAVALSVVVRLRAHAPGAARRGRVRTDGVVQRRAEEGAAGRESRLLSDVDPARAAAAHVSHRPHAAGDLSTRRAASPARARRPTSRISFAELFGNFKAYGVGQHRHEPEIRQGLHLGERDHARVRAAPAADRARHLLDDARRLHQRRDRRGADAALRRGVCERAVRARAAGRARCRS